MTAELTVKNTHIFYPKLVKVYADLARKSIRLLTRFLPPLNRRAVSMRESENPLAPYP